MSRPRNANTHNQEAHTTARIEARIGTIESEQASTRVEIHGLKDTVDGLTLSIERLATDFRHQGRTDWKLVLTAIGILVVLGGLWIQPTQKQADENTEAIRLLIEKTGQVSSTRWTRADHDRFEDRLDIELDNVRAVVAQHAREVSLNTQKIDGLDGMRISDLERRISTTEDELSNRSVWMMDTHSSMAARDAEMKAHLEELEIQIREISTEQRARAKSRDD